MLNHPRLLGIVSILAMWVTARAGAWIREYRPIPAGDDKENLALVVSATLTLLGLIIGFTFSMATTRYDQRRLYEENEANAIGTEYVRADLLPPDQAASTKHVLRQYLDHRIAFYQAVYGDQLTSDESRTAALQAQLWQSIRPQAAAQPNPVTALVVSGMNDVLNSQGYTQFAWWNRIPIAAWDLLLVLAVFANGLVGYSTRRTRYAALLLVILPCVVAISLFLIADIDSPRGGIIRIAPQNLLSLAQSLRANPPQ